jgi:hypothetical protein
LEQHEKIVQKKKTLVLAASDICKVFVCLSFACGDEFSSRVCVIDAMASCSMLAQSPLQISSLSFCPRLALVQEKEYHYDCSLLQASCGIISCSCFSQSSSLSLQVEEENKPFCSLPDLANSTDFHEFEKFVTSAHALVRT